MVDCNTHRANHRGVLGHTRQMRRSALSARLLRYLHTALLGWSLCVMAYSILAVELTLAWNHVEGVYEVVSTGQFIPLLIGILGLGRAVVSAVTEHRVPLRGSVSPSVGLSHDGHADDASQRRLKSRRCERTTPPQPSSTVFAATGKGLSLTPIGRRGGTA